jgi:hypothetical protein
VKCHSFLAALVVLSAGCHTVMGWEETHRELSSSDMDSGGDSAGVSGFGGSAGMGGTGGAPVPSIACGGTPTRCGDLGSDEPAWLFGCCDNNTRWWCEFDGTDWSLRVEACATTARVCDYDASAKAMRCMGGAGGTGGGATCASGECVGSCQDCDGDPTDCETDTNNDPEHCGECGSSCQGGKCSGGKCQVSVLAPNQKTPWGIAVDGASVFWLAEGDGSVYSVPVGGGTAEPIATGQNGPVQIALDGEYVFWTNFQGGGSVRRMKKDGTDLTTLAQASGPWALAVGAAGDNYVYWTNTSDGSLRRIVKPGGHPVVLLTGESSPRGIAVDGTHMYWTTSGGGQVRRANLDGTAPETLVTGQNYPLGVALDDTWVYWTEVGAGYALDACSQANGRIVRAKKSDGSDLMTVADNQACPLNLVVQNGLVHWTNTGTVTGGASYNYDGTVQSAAVDGTNPKLIATGQDRPYGIAVSDVAVFWSNQGVFSSQGSIMKIAK